MVRCPEMDVNICKFEYFQSSWHHLKAGAESLISGNNQQPEVFRIQSPVLKNYFKLISTVRKYFG